MIALDRPLPAELLRRNSRGLLAYALYPVFSWPWLRKRTFLVSIGASAIGALIMIAGVAMQQDLGRYTSMLVHFMVGALGISSLGPLLATLVRQARWPKVRERRAVIAAIALGGLLSFPIDQWASQGIDRGLANPAPPQPPALGWQLLNLLVLVGIYGLVGGGPALRRYLGEERDLAALAKENELAALRAEKHALDMRLSMLQAQIEPHFLFNTLASVRSLISTDPTLAATTVELLVDYLRATIPRLREAELDSTLGQQLEICESYLRLMCVRISRLRYEIDVAPALRARQFPALLLISLVENALKHGIEPKVGPGMVCIRAEERGGRLRVEVKDDGVGLRAGCGGGLGLSNLREQLQARYGEHASFCLCGAAEGGASATIEIP